MQIKWQEWKFDKKRVSYGIANIIQLKYWICPLFIEESTFAPWLMRLHCRADFRDSFLHVNGGVLERLMGPLKVPIVQLAGSNGSVLMWAVGDESIEVEGVHLSATVAEELGFKHHEKVSHY